MSDAAGKKKKKPKKKRKKPVEVEVEASDSEPADSAPSAANSEPSAISEPSSTGSEAGTERTLDDLIKDAGHKNAKRREKAAHLLGNMGEDAAEASLVLGELLQDETEAVQLRAARALGKIGPSAAAAVPNLVTALSEGTKDRTRDSKSVAGVAARALKKIGPAALPGLLRAMTDDDLRRRAARVIGTIEPDERDEIATALGELLIKKDTRPAQAALTGLAKHKRDGVPFLLLGAASDNRELREQARDLIEKLGRGVVPDLAEALEHDRPEVRAAAAACLGRLAARSQRAVVKVLDHLFDALVDEASDVRMAVIETLGKLPEYAEKVLPGLIEALGDAESAVGLQAVAAILDLGLDKDDLCARMIAVLEGKATELTRVGACMILMHLGKDAKAAVPNLVKALESKSTEVREYAHLALQAIRTPSMRLEVIRTASMRLKVVDDEDEESDEGPKAPRKRKRRARGAPIKRRRVRRPR